MFGRLAVAAGWQIQYMWCMELFPTTARLSLLNASLIFGHMGSAAAPYVNEMVKPNNLTLDLFQT